VLVDDLRGSIADLDWHGLACVAKCRPGCAAGQGQEEMSAVTAVAMPKRIRRR
jgi:hypothetical protein